MDRLVCVRASAGSGKTFALAARYLALLFLGAKPSEILAVTFTNKAANEMRSRIVEYLRKLPQKLDFLKALEQESGLAQKELLAKRQEVLQNFLTSDLYIMTIDSFLQRIARKFAYYKGIDVGFDVRSDRLEDIWRLFIEGLSLQEFDQLIHLAREQKGTQQFFENLYTKEKEFYHLLHRPIEHRFFDVMRELQKGKDILRSFEDRCEALSSLLALPLTKFASDGKWSTIRKKETIFYGRSAFNSCDRALEPLILEVARLSGLYLQERERFLKSMIFRFYRNYRAKKWGVKLEEDYLDFIDVLHLVFELLREDSRIDNAFLYFRLDTRIRHILIDEFQDTSITQWRIFEPLVEEISSSGEDFRSFFYVGDTKQAIYRFRGGSSELFDLVGEQIPHLQERRLNVNYRSKSTIVEFVNEVFDLSEIAADEGEGYVELKIQEKGKWHENLKASLQKLLDAGADPNDIAILVYDNATILEVAEFIEREFNLKAVTSTQKKVIHQPKARAVIELLKGLYYKERGRLFLANFLSFVGEPLDSEIAIEIDSPAKMVKSVLDRYNLWDSSTLKLLEHSMEYKSLIDFVYRIEDFDAELPNGAEGINVLTIHKAKGLEFDHIIVIDQPYIQKVPPIIYDYDGVELQDIRIRVKGLEALDRSYKKALEKEKALMRKDAQNREYVAYTRAKNSLFILKNEKQSSFLALEEKKMSEHSRGVLTINTTPSSNKVEKFTKELKFVGYQEHKKPKEYKPNDFEAIYLGLAVHALFEMDGSDYALNHYGGYCDFSKAKELYERAKSDPIYCKFLDGKVYREYPFIYGGQQGAIDLLIERDDEIIIIDYKSATPTNERSYQEQVGFYIKAMRAIKKKPVRGYLFYLDSCSLKEVV